MAKTIKTNQLPIITNLTNAKIIGLDGSGVDAQFKISDIKGDYKGLADSTTMPVSAGLNQFYIAAPGFTYTNFLDSASAPIVVPTAVSTVPVLFAILSYTGTSWLRQLINYSISLTDYAKKTESVIFKDLAVSVTSNNILSPADRILDVYISSTGGELTATLLDTFFTTPFLPWLSNTQIVTGLNGVIASNLFTIAQYDVNKTFIAGSFQGVDNQPALISKVANAVYFRFTAAKVKVNQVNRGGTILAYDAYTSIPTKRLGYRDGLNIPSDFKPDISDTDLIAAFASKIQGVGFSNSYITDTTNKYNAASLTINKYLNPDGTLTDITDPALAGQFFTTDYFSWDAYTQMVAAKNSNITAGFIFRALQFDSAKNVVSGSFQGTDNVSPTFNKYTGASFIRFTGRYATTNQINYGATPLTYRGYLEQILFKIGTTDAAGNASVFKPDVNDAELNAKFSTIPKTYEALVTPAKIYTLCNDLDKTSEGFASHNFAAVLYVDHFLKLTTKKNAYFKSTQSDKLPVYAPISNDNAVYNGGVNVSTVTVSDIVVGEIIDTPFSFSHISTLLSAVKTKFPKVLCIGDSVTNLTGASYPLYATLNNPAQYWAYMRKMNLVYKTQSGGANDYNFLTIGRISKRNFLYNSATILACAEGRGGWTTGNYLNTLNYLSQDNYFYDAAQAGTNKFSLAYFVNQNKTLNDDGITRLVAGSTAGPNVTNPLLWDVCTPTHVVIQLGFNDLIDDYKTNIPLMVARIKTEYPNMIIILSIIDEAGTYYPEKYPMFDYASINFLAGGLHAKMYDLVNFVKGLENVGNRVYALLSYFVQPTAWGVTTREINYPEYMADTRFILGESNGPGYNYHPSTFAHASWAYQMDALIKYTSLTYL